MKRRAAVQEKSSLKGLGVLVAIILGALSAPVLASSGVVVDCEEADTLSTLVTTTASGPISTDADEAKEESEDAKEESAEESTPQKTVTTRLPGASEAVLPSFRRQMLRTDI